MRRLFFVCLSLVVAVAVLATWPLPASNSAGESDDADAAPTPIGWRYTTTGWKYFTRPIASGNDEKAQPTLQLHPALVAVMQLLLSIAALTAFSTSVLDRRNRKADSVARPANDATLPWRHRRN